jgi:hypothetical protein
MIERFMVDVSKALGHAQRLKARHLPGLQIGLSLPFLTINVSPNDVERRVAREVVIRCRDRRVLNARECCDGCIDQALSSLQELRAKLVDKQVDLSEAQDGPLYLLLELMLDSVRQFLTFEQRLRSFEQGGRSSEMRDGRIREAYFQALECYEPISTGRLPKSRELVRPK